MKQLQNNADGDPTNPKEWKKKRGYTSIAYISILFLLCSIFFWKLFIAGQVLYSPFSDYLTGNFLFRIYNHDLFLHGGSLLWYNWNLGYPLLTFNNMYNFYEIAATILLPFLGQFNFLFHLFLAGCGTFLFLRSRKIEHFSAFIGAIIFTFCLRMIGHIYAGHTTIIYVISYFPITLYFTEKLIQALTGQTKKYPESHRKTTIACYVITIGLLFGLQFLASHIQIFVYNLFFIFLYFCYRIIYMERGFYFKDKEKKRLVLSAIVAFAAILIIFLLISAISIFNLFLLVQNYTRSEGTTLAFSSTTSLSFAESISFFLPYFFGNPDNYWGFAGNFWEGSVYVGLLPLILGIIGYFYLKRKNDKLRYFFLGTAIFSAAYALGTHTPFYDLIRNFIMPFSYFRAPARMMFYFSFATAYFAACGTTYILSRPKTKEENRVKNIYLRRSNIFVMIIFFLSCLGIAISLLFRKVFIAFGEKLAHYFYFEKYATSEVIHAFQFDYYTAKIPVVYSQIQNSMIFLGIITLLIIILLYYLKSETSFSSKNLTSISIAISIIIVIDLFGAGSGLIQTRSKEELLTKSKLVQLLEQDNDYFRVLDLTGAIPFFEQIGTTEYKLERIDIGLAKFDGLQNVNDLGKLALNVENNSVQNYNLLNLFNVKYVILPYPVNMTGYELVYHNADELVDTWGKANIRKEVFVYRNANYMPRIFYVQNYIVEKDLRKRLDLMNKSINFMDTVILESEPIVPEHFIKAMANNINMKNNQPCSEEENILTYHTAIKYTYEACLDKPGFIVLSDAYYPGWKANADGHELPVLEADHAFKAVYLPAGRYIVNIVFDPAQYRIGRIITLATAAICIILLIILSIICIRQSKR